MFNLLELPSLVQNEVLKCMDPSQLFELSLVSTKVRNIIKDAKIRVMEHTVVFEDGNPKVLTRFKEDFRFPENQILFNIVEHPKSSVTEKKMIGCHEIYCTKKDNMYYCHHRNSQFAALVVFDYIFDIFPGPINLRLYLCEVQNPCAIISNKNFEKLQRLWIYGDYEEEIDQQDLKTILQSVEIGRELSVIAAQHSNYSDEKLFDLRTLSLMDASWLTLEDLMRLKCQFGKLENHNFGINEINDFAHYWTKSTNKTLERMQFGWDEFNPFHIHKVEKTQWNPSRRSRWFYLPKEEYPSNRIDCSEGIDITRPDGLIATIFPNVGFHCFIEFLVWHDPHPEKARLENLKEKLSEEKKKLRSFIDRSDVIQSSKDVGRLVEEILFSPTLDSEDFHFWKPSLERSEKAIFHIYAQFMTAVFKIRSEISLLEQEIDNPNATTPRRRWNRDRLKQLAEEEY